MWMTVNQNKNGVIFRLTPYQIGKHVVVFQYVEVIEDNKRNFLTEVQGIYRFNSWFRAKLCTKRILRKQHRCYKDQQVKDFYALIIMYVALTKHNKTANFLVP